MAVAVAVAVEVAVAVAEEVGVTKVNANAVHAVVSNSTSDCVVDFEISLVG